MQLVDKDRETDERSETLATMVTHQSQVSENIVILTVVVKIMKR